MEAQEKLRSKGSWALVAALVVASCGREAPPPASSDSAYTPPEGSEPAGPPTVSRTWDPWADAAARGIDFRAVGNEPGWYLEVDYERWMRIFYDYGERSATVPAVEPVTRGGLAVFESSGDGHSVRAEVSNGPCNDGMSDQSYPLNVAVTIDGRPLRGCGRWLK